MPLVDLDCEDLSILRAALGACLAVAQATAGHDQQLQRDVGKMAFLRHRLDAIYDEHQVGPLGAGGV